MRECLNTAVMTVFFFFNDTAPTEIYTRSLHDALPISVFKPGNRDGVISDFALLPLQGVRAKVAAGRDFKPNANLVVIDFLLRHRHITAKDPDFEALKAGLR